VIAPQIFVPSTESRRGRLRWDA